MTPRRGLTVVAVVLAACQGVAPASTPDPADPSSPATTATTGTVPAPPTLAELATRISPHRAALRRAGVERYRFRSRVTVAGSGRMQATYQAVASVDPAVVRLRSTGMVGEFDIALSEYQAWYRYPGSDWVATERPWRWNPAGPIYSYAVAGVIAEMTLRTDAETAGRQRLAGLVTTRAVRSLEDGTVIEVWVSDEGVVMRVVVTEPVTTGGFAVSEWELYDINGDFVVEVPPP